MDNAWHTVQLDPPHQFTPWVVFEGQPVTGISDDDGSAGYAGLLSWICYSFLDANPGAVAPAGCPPDPQPIPPSYLT